MKNPLGALDANAVAQLNFPQVAKKKSRKRYLASVRSEVLDCTGCNLRAANDDTPPVPFKVEKGTVPRFVVVGEAPGPEEMRRGAPFVGPAGKTLRALFKDAKLDPYDALYCNTVSCMPTDNGQKFRQPKKPEIKSCRGNLFAQIEAGYTPYVLLVGGHALDAFRSDLTVTDHHGEVYIWMDSYLVMPIFHPGAVNRGRSEYVPEIVKDLKRWKKIVYGDDDPLKFIGRDCSKCVEQALMWDRDAVGYCMKHWERFKGQWEDDRARFGGPVNEQLKIV